MADTYLRVNVSASSANIGEVIGSLIGGYCGGRFGPKRTVWASCIPASLGWITISSSSHLSSLLLGRLLCGLSTSLSTSNCSLLVAQYRSDQSSHSPSHSCKVLTSGAVGSSLCLR